MINSRFPASHDLLNMGHDQKFNVIEVIDKLFDGPEGIECSAIYRGQSHWTQFETHIIVQKIKDFFRLMPSAKPSAFYLIGTMIHEDLNCSYLEKERKMNALKYFKLHDAVEQVYSHILDICHTSLSRLDVNETLCWGIGLCYELLKYNQRRMKATKQSMQLEAFKQTESGTRLLQFMEKVFIFILQNYPDDAFFTLIRYSDIHLPAEERQFEWLLNFFLNQFSSSVISRFIVYGGNKLRLICRDLKDPMQSDAKFIQLFSPSISIMFLIQQFRPIETTNAIEKLFNAFVNSQLEDNFEMIFLLKVCCNYPSFFDDILLHVAPLFTNQSIIKLASILNDPYSVMIRNKVVSFFDCFIRVIYRFSPIRGIDHLEKLQVMAFGPTILQNTSELGAFQQSIVSEALKVVCNEILNHFIKFIYDSKKTTLNDLMKYKELQTNDKMLSQMILQCLEVNEFGKQRCKLLYSFCIISDIVFVRRVFAAFIYAASTPEQLIQFTTFAASVILNFPSAMLEAFRELSKPANPFISMFGDKTQRFQTFSNIMTLIHWAKLSSDNTATHMSMFGLRYDQIVDAISPAELVGVLMRYGILNLSLFLEDLTKMDEKSFEQLSIITEFVKEINGAAPMEPGMSYSISRYLSIVYIHCLRLIDVNDKPSYGVAAFLKLNEVVKHLLTEKWGFSKNFFVSNLLKEILMSSTEIFGIGLDLSGLRDYYTDGTFESFLLPGGKNEASLLESYRETTVRNERARELVHSGVFKKKEKIRHEPSKMSSERARAHFFFITYQWLLSTPPDAPDSSEIVYDSLALREAANSFVDVICLDKHLSSFYHMNDWYDEKFFLSDHVEISRKLETIPICYDLMTIFAEAPYPSFFCIAPLITAQLAVIVNYCELTMYKSDKVQGNILEKIEKILTLIAKAEILTNIMPLIFEVIRRCTMHECSSILIELWRILTLIRPNDEQTLNDLMIELNIRLHESPRGIVPMPECPSLQLLKLMTLIFQRNPVRMADIGHKIISLFPPEAEEDSWESGPLFPVLAINDVLKR